MYSLSSSWSLFCFNGFIFFVCQRQTSYPEKVETVASKTNRLAIP